MWYIIGGIIGGSIGFGLSLIVRYELSLPGYILVSGMQYNSLITAHGIWMIFFMIMPILIGGFGNVLLPLMLCSSDMIFPRLNLLSFYVVLESLVFMLVSLFIDGGVNCGWTVYVPLSVIQNSSMDLVIFSLHLAGISSLLGSINFMITLIKAGSVSLKYSTMYLSLYSWSIFFTSLLLVVSLPVLAAGITLIVMDRHFNTNYYDCFRGGDVVVFQHLFWFFRHPEAYILILPAFGLVSEILSKFSCSSIFGRDSMVIAILLISLLGCIVWGHHMFMVGFDVDTRIYYTSATSIIAIPTGIKILNWISSLYSSVFYNISWVYFILGFLFSFTFGGFTGIILANTLVDILMHDTYFVVAHFHYVLSLGAVYTLFMSLISYVSLVFDRVMNELVARITFISFFISSNLIFYPMHYLGLIGFPRRIFDYSIQYLRFQYMSSLSILGIIYSLQLLIFYLL